MSNFNLNAQTGSYTIQPQDENKLVTINSPSAATVTLPQPNPGARGDGGLVVGLSNIGAGTVTVAPVSSTIDGQSSMTLHTFEGATIWSDGTNYFSVRGIGGGAAGTVTSVGLTVPSRQSVAGSPVTGAGTLAISDNNESANQVFAGPSSGSAATPTFRALVAGDLPIATTSALGAVKPDGSSITVDGTGKISASGGLSPAFGSGNPYGSGVVQATTAGGSSLAFASNVTSGNLLIVAYKSEGNISGSTCSDTRGTSYTKIASITGQNNNLVIFAGAAGGSGANSVTIGSPAGSFDRLGVMEAYGVGTTTDGTATDYAGSTPTTVTVTTATANDFLFAAVGGFHSSDTFAFDSNWTLDSQSNGSDANAIGHRQAGTAGNYSLTVTTTNGADNQPIILVAFKITSTPVSGSQGQLYFDDSVTPYLGWVYNSGAWERFA